MYNYLELLVALLALLVLLVLYWLKLNVYQRGQMVKILLSLCYVINKSICKYRMLSSGHQIYLHTSVTKIMINSRLAYVLIIQHYIMTTVM